MRHEQKVRSSRRLLRTRGGVLPFVALTVVALASCIIIGCSLGPTHAAAAQPAPPPLQFLAGWGVKGTDPGQLDQPSSIATDLRGNVYIADPGSQFVDKFQPGGTPLLSFQYPRLKDPQSIAVDRGGAIYVSDPVRCSVFIFLPDGTLYREIRLVSRPNDENTLDVAVDDDGSMSVLDVNAAKVFGFSPRFRLEHVWKPTPAAANGAGRPRSITAGPADTVLVAGIAANSLLKLDEGKIISEITLSGDSSSSPQRIGDQYAVSANYIFLADPDGKTVHVWTLNGTPKADLDISEQLGEEQRAAPPIAVSPMNDLLVLDTLHARVFRYRINF